jgi:hypothetical protein
MRRRGASPGNAGCFQLSTTCCIRVRRATFLLRVGGVSDGTWVFRMLLTDHDQADGHWVLVNMPRTVFCRRGSDTVRLVSFMSHTAFDVY